MASNRLMTTVLGKARPWRKVGLVIFLALSTITLTHTIFVHSNSTTTSAAAAASATANKLRSFALSFLSPPNSNNGSHKGNASVLKFDAFKRSNSSGQLPNCPEVPPNLLGFKSAELRPLPLSVLETKWSTVLRRGGNYRPPNCRAENRTAIIIPCRNRWAHLRVLLGHLIPFLIRQQISFTFFVVESDMASHFNKGILLNAGVRESLKFDNYNCFVFQDVDLLPLNDHNLYRCASQPTHLAVAINKFNYRLPYVGYFGGALALSREQLFAVNGHSNVYFGWGGEDDDIYHRVRGRGYKVRRLPEDQSQYHMLFHGRDEGNEEVAQKLSLVKAGEAVKRMEEEGLTQAVYTKDWVVFTPLFTWIKVTVNQTDVIQSFPDHVRKQFERGLVMWKH